MSSREPRQEPRPQPAQARRAEPTRSKALRMWMLAGVVLIAGIAVGIGTSAFMPESANGAHGSDYWGPFAKSLALGALCVLAVHLVAFAFLAPLVSYRWFDTFFLLVPVVSVIFWFRVVWRLTALPDRYWPARDEELPAPPGRGYVPPETPAERNPYAPWDSHLSL